MDRSIAFLTVKREMDFIVEADLNAVGFGIITLRRLLVIKTLICWRDLSKGLQNPGNDMLPIW